MENLLGTLIRSRPAQRDETTFSPSREKESGWAHAGGAFARWREVWATEDRRLEPETSPERDVQEWRICLGPSSGLVRLSGTRPPSPHQGRRNRVGHTQVELSLVGAKSGL